VNKVNGTVHRLTADKKEIKDFPKLPSATSFIRKTLYEMAVSIRGK
jgi:hypothetical protein